MKAEDFSLAAGVHVGVLVIWHQTEFRDAVVPLVERMGCRCAQVSSAAAGLSLAARRAGTIIMENSHPELSGVAFAEELTHRIGSKRDRTKVVLVLEHPDYEIAVRALRAGVADLLTLPLAPADLARVLRDVPFAPDISDAVANHSSRSVTLTPFDNNILVTVEAIIASRGLRCQFFDGRNLVDPAWDILLDLTRARLRGVRPSVSSVCVSTPRSTATALRSIKALEAQGVVQREEDPTDRRRSFLQLSDEAFRRMVDFIDQVTEYF